MNFKISNFFSFLLITFLLTGCLLFDNTAKIQITINKNRKLLSDLDTMTVWLPFGDYIIDWEVINDPNIGKRVGGKGYSQGNHWNDPFHWMNNMLFTNQLNIDSLNKVFEKIEKNKVYMYYFRKIDTTYIEKKFFMVTDNVDKYNDPKALIQMSDDYIP